MSSIDSNTDKNKQRDEDTNYCRRRALLETLYVHTYFGVFCVLRLFHNSAKYSMQGVAPQIYKLKRVSGHFLRVARQEKLKIPLGRS